MSTKLENGAGRVKDLTTTYIKLFAVLGGLLLFLFVAFRPYILVVQRGFDGTGMEIVYNEDLQDEIAAENVVEAAPPMAPDVGPRAGIIYQNVKVLGHLSIGQFGRMMNAISEWVVTDEWVTEEQARVEKATLAKIKEETPQLSKEEIEAQVEEAVAGVNKCTYCHYANRASEGKYTKIVSRRMIQMTQAINANWQSHVGSTGVVCYTCHRGQMVPEYIWFKGEDGPHELREGLGTRAGQNIAGVEVGLSSLPSDPFSTLLLGEYDVHVNGQTALPTGNRHSIKQAEWTYALMMHFSNSLGVNCVYCHNSRSMSAWSTSPPTRVTAWYGIRMLRKVNQEYLEPLGPTYPEYRLGKAHGDSPKAYCMTCHQGAYKPLLGARMLDGYPSLAAPAPQPTAATVPEAGSGRVVALP